MKTSFSAVAAFMLLAESSAFSPAPRQSTHTSLNMGFGIVEGLAATALSGVVGKMTREREEMYASGSMAAVAGESKAAVAAPAGDSDISVVYDSAARNAFTDAGSVGDYEAFKADFTAKAIELVIAKKCEREGIPVPGAPGAADITVVYDSAARNAFADAGSVGDYEAFKADFTAEAIELVIAKRCKREGIPVPGAPVAADISIVYDSAARNAFAAAGSEGDYEMFKEVYTSQAISMVIAKRCAREGKPPVPDAASSVSPLAIDYDSAARNEYVKAGSKGEFEAFKAQYVKDAIAQVVAKKNARDAVLAAK